MLGEKTILWLWAAIFGLLGILIGGIFYQGPYQATAQEPTSPDPIEQIEWVAITDTYYGYHFQVPSPWYRQMGVTPDRWTFFSDPNVINDQSLHPAPSPTGLIKVDFGVETVANLMPEPEVRNPLVDPQTLLTSEDLVPLLPPGEWIVINGLPALMMQHNMEDEEHSEVFVESTSVYILAERMVYYLWIAYAPPTAGDEVAAADAYEIIKSHILESFTVDLTAPVAWQPSES